MLHHLYQLDCVDIISGEATLPYFLSPWSELESCLAILAELHQMTVLGGVYFLSFEENKT